jgi:hypothetical protein
MSRLGETLAELPLTGDQVGLFKAQPGRPKVSSESRIPADRQVMIEAGRVFAGL